MEQEGHYSSRKRLCRVDIPFPSDSNWSKFYSMEHSDDAWYAYLDLSKAQFDTLVKESMPHFERSRLSNEEGEKPRACDLKRRQLDCPGTIALALVYINRKPTFCHLGEQFGLIETQCEKYTKFGLSLLLTVLKVIPDGSIIWKNHDVQYLNTMVDHICRYAPGMRDHGYKPVAWMDGVRFKIARKFSNARAMDRDYSGEKKYHLRKIQLMFDPLGEIVMATWNWPGNDSDSTCILWPGWYEEIEQLPEGYCVLADSAYQGKLVGGKVVKILKIKQFYPEGMTMEEGQSREKAIVRARQPSEWGNNDFVQMCVRIRNTLSTGDQYNCDLMEICIRLYNFRVRSCNRNHVKRFFQILEIMQDDPDLRRQLYGSEYEIS